MSDLKRRLKQTAAGIGGRHPSERMEVASAALAEIERLEDDIARLTRMIDTPHTGEWFGAVRLEAAHQIKRFGSSHDAGKAPADWFWLIGYLAGKALTAANGGDAEKAKHHTISTGAVLLNWFRAMTGDSNELRPGLVSLPDAESEKT